MLLDRRQGRGEEKQHIGFKLEATGFSLLHKASQTASGWIQLRSSMLLCKLLDFNEQARKGLTREPQHPPQQTNANSIYYYCQQQYQHSNNNLPCVHINFLSEPRTHTQKKCRGNEISLTPNNISAKCSIWSAEEISSKKNLIDAIYFCPILEVLRRRNVEQTKSEWCQLFLWNPRSNPRKKFQANKNLIDEAIYICEFLELIRRRNVSKQDLTDAKFFCKILDRISRRNVDQTTSHWCHIFLSNPRTNNL